MFETYEDVYCDEQFIHEENPWDNLPIELHWDLRPLFGKGRSKGIQDLFFRAVTIEGTGWDFRALHPVDALIHAAIHLTMHHSREMRLIWIHDIALLAKHLTVPDDWKTLQNRSIQWNARLAVENSLRLAEVWSGLRLPLDFRDFGTWPTPTDTEAATWTHAMERHHKTATLLNLFMAGSTGVFQKARALGRVVFPHPDLIRKSYPPGHDWMLPLSYFRRWLRWTKGSSLFLTILRIARGGRSS
jgi:hypothetical protein